MLITAEKRGQPTRRDPYRDHDREEAPGSKQRLHSRGASCTNAKPDAARRIGDEDHDAREYRVGLKGDKTDAADDEGEKCRQSTSQPALIKEGEEDHDDSGKDRETSEVGIERSRDDVSPGKGGEGEAADESEADRQTIPRKDARKKGTRSKRIDECEEYPIRHVLCHGRRVADSIR